MTTVADQLGALVNAGRTQDPRVMATRIGSDEELHELKRFIANGNKPLADKFVRWCQKRRASLNNLVTANGVHLVRRRVLPIVQ